MSQSRLAIVGELTIQNAAATRDRLLSAIAASDEIELDLAEVSEIDSAGVQVLLAARASAAASGKPLHLIGCNRTVADVFDYLSLTDELPCVAKESGS